MGCVEPDPELALPGVVLEPLDVNHRGLVPWCDLVAWLDAAPELLDVSRREPVLHEVVYYAEAELDQELELLDVPHHELAVRSYVEALCAEAEPDQEQELLDVRRHELVVL